MSPTLLAPAAIVIVSSLAFVVIGTVYKWDLTSRGYNRWQQGVGVFALLGLAGVSAYGRLSEPLVAGAILLGGALLSAGYVLVYRKLAAQARELLASRDGAD
jgi:drug/metabolite transporter (DMT)-like permease